MKDLFQASKVLLLDLASTLLFLVAYVLTGNLFLAVGLGMALGLAQIGWQFVPQAAGRGAAMAEPGHHPRLGPAPRSSRTIRSSSC